ncbi:SDR family oxidoreductase [Streptomyces sp. NPDC059517]|uniref:SDR family oxidoreductase n=1 Tax=Streptomyces sp. NPDC059517 TaxID=3346855 RepID=UPI0036C5450C
MRVLVTGSSRGIGRATTLEFAGRGHHVIATARTPGTPAGHGVAECLQLDVTDTESVARAAARTGPIDVLVNGAGAPLVSSPVETHPLADLKEQLDVNYLGPVRMIQAFLPAMRERGSGTIVNVGSVTGRVAQPLRGAANASKFALEGMSEALKYETGHFGIRVILVEPGATQNQPGKVKYALPGRAPHYADLFTQFEAAEKGLTASVALLTPDLVAKAIADAVESKDAPFRLTLGGDAELVLAERKRSTDEDFEARMRSLLGITW